MSEPKTLARPYAIAAYQFAKACDQLDTWSVMLSNLSILIANDKVQAILRAPILDESALLTLFKPVLEKTMNASGINFLKLLIENHRLILAPVIFELFKTIKEEAEKVISIDVTTAVSLSVAEQAVLVDTIVQRLKNNVLPSFHVDEALIAGVVIRVGDAYVVDGSLKTQLMRLKAKF